MNKKVMLSVLSTAVFASLAGSAFAAPNAGLYIGGNVKKYYSINTLIEMSKTARDQYKNDVKAAGTANLVFVNLQGKGASIKEMLDKGTKVALSEPLQKEDFADIYQVVNLDGNVSGTEDARSKVDSTPAGELKVESVSAIDDTTVQVVFTTEVDKSSAETAANYVLSKQVTPPQAPLTPAASLGADNKTVTLTFASGTFAPGTNFTLYISNVRQKDDLDVIVPQTQKSIAIADVAPAVVSTKVVGTAGGNTTVDVTFNQELVSAGTNTGYVAKTAGETDKTAASANLIGDNKTVRLTFSALTVGKAYTIELADNIANKFGKLVAADATTTINGSADTTAPTIASVTQDADETNPTNQVLKIKFSEPVSASAITGEVFAADLSHQAVTFGAVSNDTVTVLVPDTFELKAGQTYTLKITALNAIDASGNQFEVPVSKNFTAIDKVAPIAQTVTKVDNKTVTLKYNENITIGDGTIFTVDGIPATATASGSTITLKTATPLPTGTEAVTSLEINGSVKDAANNATTYASVDIAGDVTLEDKATPTIESTIATENGTTIVLSFSEALADITPADFDTPAEVANLLTITKSSGATVAATAVVNNGSDLEITVPTIGAGDVYYVKFKSGQTVVADVAGNKFTDTKSIKVTATP